MVSENETSYQSNKKSSYVKLIQWAIIVAIFVFLGKMVYENWNQVKDTSFFLRPVPLILSTIIFAFSYFIQFWAWHFITAKLGIALSFSETLESWFYSQLGKYLPGKVWLLLGRFYFYESKGKSKKEISIALYLETSTLLIAAALISLVGFLLFEKVNSEVGLHSWWLLPLLLLILFSLHPRILEKILNWFLTHFKKEPLSLSISYPNVLWVLWICVLAWMVGGIGFYLFVESLFSVPLSHLLFLTGALAFSSTLGLIAIFAPSGLGVREGALVYLLSYTMPVSVAVIISVLTRIWMTLIEIGLIGVIYLNSKLKKVLGNRN
jgi:glycosyltransferase 2 family protein